MNKTILYHGSNKFITNTIKPFTSFHNTPYVYATSDYLYALVRAGNFNPEILSFKEDYNGTSYTLVELTETAFKDTFDTEGYIYLLDNKNFSKVQNMLPKQEDNSTLLPNEYISTQKCEIQKVIYIPNVGEEILKHISENPDYYNIIYYNTSEEKDYWKSVRGGKEGYLKRRMERARKLNKMKEDDVNV